VKLHDLKAKLETGHVRAMIATALYQSLLAEVFRSSRALFARDGR
jgi:hypothetical protein